MLIALVLTAIGTTGCGGSDEPEPAKSPAGEPESRAASARALVLQADKSRLAYDKTTLSARPGKVSIVMVNPSEVSHDVAIEGNNVSAKSEVVTKGGKSTVTADLKSGTYTFYCSVEGHRQAGMTGTLTVR